MVRLQSSHYYTPNRHFRLLWQQRTQGHNGQIKRYNAESHTFKKQQRELLNLNIVTFHIKTLIVIVTPHYE